MRVLLPAFLMLLAQPALAAAGGGGPDTSTFVWQVINFLLLVGALVFLVRKPAKAYFQERREGIVSQLDEAAELQRDAEESYARWQRQLVDLESEVAQIRATAQERAEREATQILADARATAERIQQDAAAAIDSELRRAQAQLRAETSELAVELAAGILEQSVTDDDRGRLLDEFITRIEQSPSAPSNGSSN